MYQPRFFNPTRYKVNFQINAPSVRLISDDGKQVGVVTLVEARQQAQATGLDLVEIGPNAKPPVVKLISFAKFKYQEAKKQKAEKKGVKGGELKEIQATPFIGPGDYETRIKRIKEFLATGNKVKINVKFQGRQITHKEFGYSLIDKFKKDLAELATPEGEPKLVGKFLFITVAPAKKGKKNEETKSETKN